MKLFKRMPTRGLYTSAPRDMISEDYASFAQNVRFRFGSVINRLGTTLISTFATQPLWFGRFTTDTPGTTTTYTIMITNSFMYRLSAGVWTLVDTFNSIAFPGAGRFGVAIGENKIFVTRDGMGHIQYWDGNTANPMVRLATSTAVTGFPGAGLIVPEARYLEYFSTRVWEGFTVFNSADASTRLQFSVVGNSGNWDTTTTGGFLDLTTSATGEEQAEPLTGMRGLAGRLVFYKRRSIGEVTPTGISTPQFTSEVRIRGQGCAAPYTLANAGHSHFFLGDDNVYAWDGVQLRTIGDPIQKDLLGIIDNNQLLNYFGSLDHSRQEYYLVLSSGITFVYDYLRDTWTSDVYPSTATVFLSALGEADFGTTVYTWLTITGTWLSYNVAWDSLNIAGTPSLLGAGPQGGTFGTFYTSRMTALDYDGSSPSQGVTTKEFLATSDSGDDPWLAMNLFRVLLRYGANNVTQIVVTANGFWDTFYTSQATATTPTSNGNFSWLDLNISGSGIQLTFATTGGLFEWQSYSMEVESSGEQLPIS